MGDGFAVQSTQGTLYAPITGKVTTVFPTQHAFGILSDTGLGVLDHIGIDTVNLKGKGFSLTLKQGDYVDKGQVVGSVDLDELIADGYDTTTMIIVTNSSNVIDYTFPQ